MTIINVSSIEQLKQLATEHGSHFFDADAMRFFSSRVHSAVYGGRYFVTSEQQRAVYISSGFIPAEPRRYTVRIAQLYYGANSAHITFDAVESLGGFQAFETRHEAHSAARALAREQKHLNSTQRFAMLDAAIECLLWSSVVSVAEDDEPVQADSLGLELSADALETLEAELNGFLAVIEDDEQLPHYGGLSAEQLGHDFILTKNGHGTGFWDRGLGTIGERVTYWAKTFGSTELYVSGNGTLEIF